MNRTKFYYRKQLHSSTAVSSGLWVHISGDRIHTPDMTCISISPKPVPGHSLLDMSQKAEASLQNLLRTEELGLRSTLSLLRLGTD